jgi:hypothetical protein
MAPYLCLLLSIIQQQFMETGSYIYNSPGTVSAVFMGKTDVERAYSGLLQLGYQDHEIALLMSDETLVKHTYAPDESVITQDDTGDTFSGRSRKLIANAILSLTSMISLPELGIAISKHLVVEDATMGNEKEQSRLLAVKEQYDTYQEGVREGGIIISVDPKNRAERDAIVREFRINNGQDILGDDGYTELH